ncbi:MAG: DUF2784 family protein [bacterium]
MKSVKATTEGSAKSGVSLRTRGYQALNLLCHALHLALIAFLALGWMAPVLRPYHLGLIALTLASWLSFGYCPLTEAQWWIRKKLGLKGSSGPYVPFFIQKFRREPVNSQKIDKVATNLGGLIGVLSLALNVADFLSRRH